MFSFLKKKEVAKVFPSYGEVLTAMAADEIHNAFIAIEVLTTDSSEFTCKNNARILLENIANLRNWDFDTFIDIIVEEYEVLYEK